MKSNDESDDEEEEEKKKNCTLPYKNLSNFIIIYADGLLPFVCVRSLILIETMPKVIISLLFFVSIFFSLHTLFRASIQFR